MFTPDKQTKLAASKPQRMPDIKVHAESNKKKEANDFIKKRPNIARISHMLEKTKLESQSPNYFPTNDIHFSQASISLRFRNGALISDLSTKLLNSEINVSAISCIRVVRFQEKWVTLDNRRLRAFMDAMIAQVPAQVCSLNDPQIYREFHDKRTNKSSDGGGIVRKPQTAGTAQHFEGGTFTFVKRILNLTFEQLAEPMVGLHRKAPLPSHFQSATEYYEGFLELILEEARASLQAGIEANATNENTPFELMLQLNYKSPKNPQNPASLSFRKKISERRLIKANDAFLLIYRTRHSNIQLLALASYAPSPDLTEVQLKVVTEEDIVNDCPAFEAGATWMAKPIGSLVTHLRMFDVCTMRPSIAWMDNLLSGNLRKNSDLSVPSIQHQSFNRLNVSQQDAVNKFLKLDSGIQLVQGPPGTGKTTMVVGLLELLIQQGRTLVCAPSNKAVQILAERFASEYRLIPAILAGVEDKIPKDNSILRQMFIHTWGSEKLEVIANLMENLWTLFPSPLFVGSAKNRVKKIEDAILQMNMMTEDFIALLPDFKKYNLNILTDTHIESFTRKATQYIRHMTEKGMPLAKKRVFISKKDLDNPEKLDPNLISFFDEARAILSETASLLSQLELTLNLRINDDSSTGLEAELLNQSSIIFTTLSVSGRKRLQEMQPVNALVVDEAGQALEAETLIPLVTRPRKCLLIGDTNQLPATVISPHATKLRFDRSLMWRLLEDCKQQYSMLITQYRMHPAIRLWPSKQYYQARIQDSIEIASGKRVFLTTKEVPPFIAPYSFIHLEGQETKSGRSFRNQQEADSIVTILQYLKNHLSLNVASQVGVITFYKGQALLINEKISKVFPGIKVNTVDSFQGDENDIIIISSVRSNARGKIGFLNDFRRLNVALTRAKHGLIIVGNAYTLEKEKHDLALLVSDAQKRKCFYLYNEIKAHLDPKPKPLAFDVERAKKSILRIAPTFSPSKLPIDNSRNIIPATQRCIADAKQAAINPHKSKNNNLCSFDQKSPGSCRKGANCDFSHGTLELKLPTIDTKNASESKPHIVHALIPAKIVIRHANNGIGKPTQLNTVSRQEKDLIKKDKPKNKPTLSSFDQKNPGSCRKGTNCDFSNRNNQQALSHPAQRNLHNLSRLPEMNAKPATSTTTSTIASKATTPVSKPGATTSTKTSTTSQIAASKKMPTTSSTPKPGSATSTTTSTIASKATTPTSKPGATTSTKTSTTSQIATSTKMPATSTLKSGSATSTTTSTIASKVTTPVPKPGATTSTTTSQITTRPTVSSTTQATNLASEKRVNDAKREGAHRPPLPKTQPEPVKECTQTKTSKGIPIQQPRSGKKFTT